MSSSVELLDMKKMCGRIRTQRLHGRRSDRLQVSFSKAGKAEGGAEVHRGIKLQRQCQKEAGAEGVEE